MSNPTPRAIRPTPSKYSKHSPGGTGRTVPGSTMRSLKLAPVLAAALAAACHDGPTAPTYGELVVTVSTSGGDLPETGYRVMVDTVAGPVVEPSGTVTIPGVPVGTHQVSLSGVPDHCEVSGPHPRSVTVSRSGAAQASFAVICQATGVQLTTVTGGLDLPGGYEVTVDGGEPRFIAPSGEVTISRLAPGSHTVTLSGAPANCEVEGDNPRVIEVVNRSLTPVGFAVTCTAATGNIQVAATTTGLDLDADGYTLQVDGGAPVGIAANGVTSVAGLTGGDHTVVLGGLAANCALSGESLRTLTVATGGLTRDTARTTFEVTCTAATGVLEVTIETSGQDAPPDGYSVRVGDAPQRQVPTNAVTRFSDVAGGEHPVRLDSVPENCAVAGDNPRTVQVSAGGLTRDTARTSFEVACTRVPFKIAFTRSFLDSTTYQPSYQPWITVAYADGSHPVALARGQSPAWSPDGARIAFARTTCYDDYYYGTYCYSAGLSVMNANGTGLANLSVNSGDYAPSWRPDGARIAFIRNDRLHVMTADGSVTQIATTAAAEPAWSPDGTRIVFTCQVDATWWDICSIAPDGTGLVPLTSDGRSNSRPSWSPDGSRIGFTRVDFTDASRDPPPSEPYIAVMNADGTGRTRLTDGWSPRWSRDGELIVFVRGTGLHVIRADGSLPAARVTSDTSDNDPDLRP
jgi:hypothetical protein